MPGPPHLSGQGALRPCRHLEMVCWQRCRKQIKACVQLSGIPPRAHQSARHSRRTGPRTDPPVPLRVRVILMQRGRSSAWPWAWLLRLTSWKSSGEPAVIDRAIACCMALADSSMRRRGAAVDGGQPALSSEHRARRVCPTGVPARAERDGVASCGHPCNSFPLPQPQPGTARPAVICLAEFVNL